MRTNQSDYSNANFSDCNRMQSYLEFEIPKFEFKILY